MAHPQIAGHLPLNPMLLCLRRVVVGRMRDEHISHRTGLLRFISFLVLQNFHPDFFFSLSLFLIQPPFETLIRV